MASGSALLDARASLAALGVGRGHHVADLGVGRTGHFVLRAGEAVGESGKVYAVDILKEALAMVDGSAQHHGRENVHTVWGDVERGDGVAIPSASLDVALLVHTLATLTEWDATAREVRRMVKAGGKIAVIDWLPAAIHVAAPMVDRRMSPQESDILFAHAGCQKCGELTPSRWHWGRVYSA